MMSNYSDAQMMYWDISERRARAISLHAHLVGRARRLYGPAANLSAMDEIGRAKMEMEAAEDAYQAFSREHAGQEFRVFRPSSIQRAISDDLKSLSSYDEDDGDQV